MRLLHTKELYLKEFFDKQIPSYAILSHTWEDEEISYGDFLAIRKLDDPRYAPYHEFLRLDLTRSKDSAGYKKILECCKIAASDRYQWVWIDTCCIDKTSSAELQEAINSMFKWYRRAESCYAYLADVRGRLKTQCLFLDGRVPENLEPIRQPQEMSQHAYEREEARQGSDSTRIDESGNDQRTLAPPFLGRVDVDGESEFRASRWFTRAWTLQELIAPRFVEFFNRSWQTLGNKRMLASEISAITGIDTIALTGNGQLRGYCVAKKMAWAANRKTTRIEDTAYSLLGLFDINMPLLYGEGSDAFLRLQEEIIKKDDDETIFAHNSLNDHDCLLATSPDSFAGCKYQKKENLMCTSVRSNTISSRGLRMDVYLLPIMRKYVKQLRCRSGYEGSTIDSKLIPLRCAEVGSVRNKGLGLVVNGSFRERRYDVHAVVDLGGFDLESIHLERKDHTDVWVKLRPTPQY